MNPLPAQTCLPSPYFWLLLSSAPPPSPDPWLLTTPSLQLPLTGQTWEAPMIWLWADRHTLLSLQAQPTSTLVILGQFNTISRTLPTDFPSRSSQLTGSRF